MVRLIASTSTKSRRCATRGAGAIRACSTRWTSAWRRALTASPFIRGPTSGTSRRATCVTSRSASRERAPAVEFNIEGDPRPDLLELVEEVAPDQCTLVPVVPGEITSQAGWTARPQATALPAMIARLRARSVRVSLFIDPRRQRCRSAGPPRWAPTASSSTPNRLRARSNAAALTGERSFGEFCDAARLAHSLGLGVNAGHDLDLDNLVLFRDLPFLDEVSIGHAIISRARSSSGSSTVVREYLHCVPLGQAIGMINVSHEI